MGDVQEAILGAARIPLLGVVVGQEMFSKHVLPSSVRLSAVSHRWLRASVLFFFFFFLFYFYFIFLSLAPSKRTHKTVQIVEDAHAEDVSVLRVVRKRLRLLFQMAGLLLGDGHDAHCYVELDIAILFYHPRW